MFGHVATSQAAKKLRNIASYEISKPKFKETKNLRVK
jgi:hypothetical protein